ncbi:MAG: MotA/TolQ/ExbB proton channel family protein [Pseudomonadales bacterium]|jgi:biopolymer transport protein ExbB/TolQ|nr:MotA/TolQ/ExbB proton channel family protein [Pseudomonadales bacterium]
MKNSDWLMAMQSNKSMDRFINIVLLLLVTLVIQTVYAVYVRPSAAAWLVEQQILVNADPTYSPPRSVLVIISEPEPQASITVSVWALLLGALRAAGIKRTRNLLEGDLLQLQPGSCILPDDTRDHLRRFEQLPKVMRESMVPRVLQSALKRFGATRNIQDAATTVHHICEIESTRLESELSMIRFAVWSIPAIGFVGTVRGLGKALESAQFVLNSTNPGALTSGLGLSFNSTFTALTLCILVMYVYNELQLAHDRLVLDTEQYAEDELISRLRTDVEQASAMAVR